MTPRSTGETSTSTMRLPMDPEFRACRECWEPLEVGTRTCPNCLAKDPFHSSCNIVRGVFMVALIFATSLSFVILRVLFY